MFTLHSKIDHLCLEIFYAKNAFPSLIFFFFLFFLLLNARNRAQNDQKMKKKKKERNNYHMLCLCYDMMDKNNI